MNSKENSRLQNSIYNIIWSVFSVISMAVFGIVSRAIFVRMLGDELMGVNSLFSDVLKLFSFAEMGFGTAITFSLYKPIAENNTEKIKSLLVFYKNVYSFTAAGIAVIGLCFAPFLGLLKTTIPLKELRIYYAIFLLDNVISYIAAYRETYVSAKQQARKVVLLNTFFYLSTIIIQIVIVVFSKIFILYLLANTVLIVVRKVVVNTYILKLYPETDIRGVKSIEKEEKVTITNKVKALAIHKIANLAISQTDSLIVSLMINVTQWGLVSNYLSLRNTITNITWQVFKSISPSMGDLVARESQETQLNTVYMYTFVNSWMYSFFFIALATLSSPFISLVYGNTRVVDNFTVFLLFLNVFFNGLKEPISMIKDANGAFESDKMYAVASSVVNLITSVILVKLIGLPGVFLGTICSTMVILISRPFIVFNQIYGISSNMYFKKMGSFIRVTLVEYMFTLKLVNIIIGVAGLSVPTFIALMAVVTVVPNLMWLVVYHKDVYLKQGIAMLTSFVEPYIFSWKKSK